MTNTPEPAPMREDENVFLRRLLEKTGSTHYRNAHERMSDIAALLRHRLAIPAHTARPDAGDKAEIERLRGLLIDPGSPPWEDARAVLVVELSKTRYNAAAYQIANGQGAEIPSNIALNLIAQAGRRSDAGDEVERLRAALYRIAKDAFVSLSEMPDADQLNGWRKVAIERIEIARAALLDRKR